MNIRPLSKEEQKYTYAQSTQLNGQTGAIGYLRGDFGTTGGCFYTSWFDTLRHLKTDAFKVELDEVVNALRSDEYGLLKDRFSMLAYGCRYESSRFNGNYCPEYGFRVDTGDYAYLLRCNPTKGDYNFYCWCFVKEWLDRHIQNASNGIRFIDPGYNELFRIPDGEKIIVHFAWGEKEERACRFIDEAHAEIGSTLYHICQFAEIMQQNGHTYEPKNPAYLPQAGAEGVSP